MTVEAKQWIILDKSLGMSKGKLVAQGSHQSVALILQDGEKITHAGRRGLFIPFEDTTDGEALESWLDNAFTKVTLAANGIAEVMDIFQKARKAGLRVVLIEDAGRTELGRPTVTGVGIGPHTPDQVEGITDHLPLYK
jgi:PTH2 family peptidyl-tRNA hydrolase